jgi:hypothetical protein
MNRAEEGHVFTVFRSMPSITLRIQKQAPFSAKVVGENARLIVLIIFKLDVSESV